VQKPEPLLREGERHVITESSENTISRSMIWKMTPQNAAATFVEA
jgi:hypothetical protein